MNSIGGKKKRGEAAPIVLDGEGAGEVESAEFDSLPSVALGSRAMTAPHSVGRSMIAVLLLFGLQGCSRDHPAPAKAGPDTTVTVEIIANMTDA